MIASLLLASFPAGFVFAAPPGATLLFEDTFEQSGQSLTNKWSDIPSGSSANRDDTSDDGLTVGVADKGLLFEGEITGNPDESAEREISTRGHSSLFVEYSRTWAGLESDDHFVVSYALDGGSFTTLEDVTGALIDADTTHTAVSFEIPNANRHTKFELRFAVNGTNDNDEVGVDNVRVYGTGAPNFHDGFESGSLSGSWTILGTPLVQDEDNTEIWTDDNDASDGWAAELDGVNSGTDDELRLAFPTTGLHSIYVRYAREVENLDSGEGLRVSYTTDGTTITDLEARFDNDSYESVVFGPLPASANNNPDFGLRFQVSASSASEDAYLDDVVIWGTPLPTPPSVSVTGGPEDPTLTNDKTPTFTFSTTGSPSTTECRIDTDAFVPCISSYTPGTDVSDGPHTFEVKVSDEYGQTDTATRSFTVDAIIPVVTIDTIVTPTNDSTPTILFSVNESATVMCAIDDGDPVSCASSFTPSSPLSDGAHTLTVTATDPASNQGIEQATFTVDTTGPLLNLSGLSDGAAIATPTTTFTFAPSDESGVASIECSAELGLFAACTDTFTFENLVEGAHSFALRATDTLGNTTTEERDFTVRLTGTISVDVITTPAADDTIFTFVTSGTGFSGVMLADDDPVFVSDPLQPAVYGITAPSLPDWDLVSDTCSGDEDPAAIDLSAAEDVACTFTFVKRANLTITNASAPNEGVFEYTTLGPAPHDGDGTTVQFIGSGSNGTTFSNVVPGIYSINRTFIPEDWSGNESFVCTSSLDEPVSGTGSAVADLELSPGESIECVFSTSEFGTITGNKFRDRNADGIDVGDPGKKDWGIRLFFVAPNADSTGELPEVGDEVMMTFSGAGGNFSFISVPAATYLMCEDTAQAWHQSFPSDGSLCENGTFGYQIDVRAGEMKTGYQFGNWKEASIGGFKFNDLSGDGVRQNGEAKLEGWTIELYEAGSETATTTRVTGDNGRYLFEGLRPGDYVLREVGQEGWTATYPVEPNEHALTIRSGAQKKNLHFGNAQAATVSGVKWEDRDADGIRDEGEALLASVSIHAVPVDENGDTDPLREEKVVSTDSEGDYMFSFFPSDFGLWRIQESVPEGWVQTAPALPAYYDVSVSGGAILSGYDFGNWQQIFIATLKWHDHNVDGVRDEGEEGVSGWPTALGFVEEGQIDVPIEIIALSLTGENGVAHIPVPLDVLLETPNAHFVVLEGTRESWRPTAPAMRLPINVIFREEVEPTPLVLDSFFDIFIQLPLQPSQQAIVTEGIPAPEADPRPIAFGNVEGMLIGDAFLIPTEGGTAEETTGATPFGGSDVVLSISDDEGTSSVTIPAGTVITRTDAQPFALADLTIEAPGEGTVSGLTEGDVVDGVLQWGIVNHGLTFTPAISVSIFVGVDLNGQTLTIQRSTSGNDGWTSDGISPTTCVVAGGVCTFTATQASYYATTHTNSGAPTSSTGPSTPFGGGITTLGTGGGGGSFVFAPVTTSGTPGASGTPGTGTGQGAGVSAPGGSSITLGPPPELSSGENPSGGSLAIADTTETSSSETSVTETIPEPSSNQIAAVGASGASINWFWLGGGFLLIALAGIGYVIFRSRGGGGGNTGGSGGSTQKEFSVHQSPLTGAGLGVPTSPLPTSTPSNNGSLS